MPGRSYSAGDQYRYGFNGKENDNEVKGEGNQQDYGMRIYDTRLGRFLSVDPLTPSYPWYTSYQFAGNIPIKFIDKDGAEPDETIYFMSEGVPKVNKEDVKEMNRRISSDFHNEVLPRVGGFLRAAGGILVMAATWEAAWTPFGFAAFTFGADQASTGLQEMLYGSPRASITEQILVDHGQTPEQAHFWSSAGMVYFGSGYYRPSPLVSQLGPLRTSPELNQAEALAAKARVFEAGGEIGMMDGAMELSVNSNTRRLTASLNLNDKAVFLEGIVSTENNILTIKNIGIRNQAGNYNNTDLVNEIGPGMFKKMIDQLKDLRIKGGYKEGKLEFERMKPEGSKLKDREEIAISFYFFHASKNKRAI